MVVTEVTVKRRQFLAARERASNPVTIGFAGIADFRNVFGQEYIAGVAKAAADYGLNLLNFAGAVRYSLSGDVDFIDHYIKKYRFMRFPIIDGLVTWASSLNAFLSYEEIQEIHRKLQPLPMVDLGVPILDDVPVVTIDATEGISLIMNHLIEDHGYTRIGFVGSETGKQYQERYEAFREGLRRHGLIEDPQKTGILEAMKPKDVSRWIDIICQRFLLRERREIDAIVTVSDITASYIVEELLQRGVQVPGDVAVTGFNNQFHSMSAPCSITTVDLGYFDRGFNAVELLLDRIIDPSARFGNQIGKTSLVIRQSCGCFEEAIAAAGRDADVLPAAASDVTTTAVAASPNGNSRLVVGTDGQREALAIRLRSAIAGFAAVAQTDLLDCLLRDLNNEPGEGLLVWLQRTLIRERDGAASHLMVYQKLISDIRRAFMSLTTSDAAELHRLENILHQARMILSVAGFYHEQSHRSDAYRFNNLARIAISFASALSGAQVLDAIRYHLPELEMPGIMLALQDELLPDLGNVSLELVHPNENLMPESLPLRLNEGVFIPRSFFPKNRRWSMMMEILYYSGKYIGYALIEMGPPNVALYDAVRTLLSHSLYAVYIREGRNSRLRDSLLHNERVSGILGKHGEGSTDHYGIDAQKIVEYLVDRIGEMTDVNAMAHALSISKSYLIRRTKSLTGYTVQALHEMLKIERAKTMLENRQHKIAEVATELGYQNQCYFSTVFKKNTGASPRDWQKRQQ